jgi:RNA polymerase sigma factor (sigma-70 family)
MTRVMSSNPTEDETAVRTAAQFATTHWSVVLAAGDSGSPASREALDQLCRRYWLPVYTFVRRRGHDHAEAEDLTQSFFEQLIQKQLAGRADPERGRFRNFLLKVLTQFLSDARKQRCRIKRGGDSRPLSLNESAADQVVGATLGRDPEIAYLRKWALATLDEVLALLKREWDTAGKSVTFETLNPYLQGECGLPHYGEVARTLGITEASVKTTVHRLRQRYRELLRGVVAQTVADPAEIDDEIRFLLRVLSR